ncbi:lysozyme inhibitor LprI family protein [Paenibacillus sp. IHBB 3054]|uniref:lysozyme inhibitor LprI family protein n=1 Tax=Paenibacillus sp. IHBB 3054 TaxID=3425689 RepID=UPI003F67D446
MRKTMILTLLTCSLVFAGCSNNADSKVNSAEPDQTAQQTATASAPTTTPEATPATTPEATPEETSPETSPAIGQEPAAGSMKQDYLQKLDKIEEGLTDLQALSDEGTTASMIEAADKEYGRWDAALNEIYQVLKQQLPKDEMAKLKEKQLNWITERDETAAKAAAEFEGGTMEPLEYAATQSEVTKERCYELVELYMK